MNKITFLGFVALPGKTEILRPNLKGNTLLCEERKKKLISLPVSPVRKTWHYITLCRLLYYDQGNRAV